MALLTINSLHKQARYNILFIKKKNISLLLLKTLAKI